MADVLVYESVVQKLPSLTLPVPTTVIGARCSQCFYFSIYRVSSFVWNKERSRKGPGLRGMDLGNHRHKYELHPLLINETHYTQTLKISFLPIWSTTMADGLCHLRGCLTPRKLRIPYATCPPSIGRHRGWMVAVAPQNQNRTFRVD